MISNKAIFNLFHTIFLSVVAVFLPAPVSAQVEGTCSSQAFLACDASTSLQCRISGNAEACQLIIAQCRTDYINQCLSARSVTATYYVKYNTAGADYNFLEVSNLSKTDRLIGAYRIYDVDGNIIGQPREFDIKKRGRMDFDIHSQVGPQVYGQLEISIYSDNIAASVYSSFYNQRKTATVTGVLLDQTSTVKGELAPE